MIFKLCKGRKSLNADYLFDLKINKNLKRKEFQKSFNEDIKKYIKIAYPSFDNYRYSFHGLRSHFISKFLKNQIIFKTVEKFEDKASLVEVRELKKLVRDTNFIK